MNAGIEATNTKANDDAKMQASMPDMSALTNMAAGMHKMGLSQKQRQVNSIAAKLGVPAQKSDELLSPETLSTTMITRALSMGKT